MELMKNYDTCVKTKKSLIFTTNVNHDNFVRYQVINLYTSLKTATAWGNTIQIKAQNCPNAKNRKHQFSVLKRRNSSATQRYLQGYAHESVISSTG